MNNNACHIRPDQLLVAPLDPTIVTIEGHGGKLRPDDQLPARERFLQDSGGQLMGGRYPRGTNEACTPY